jgi:AraC family transcriptional regulator
MSVAAGTQFEPMSRWRSGGCICYAARVDDSKLSKPLGRTLRRKEIGSFVFVHHDYPTQAARATHSHPWLHLTLVCRGLYSRKLGRQSFDYKTGSLTFLPTNESHTDCYAAGSKCLHVVIPSNVERALTSAFGTQGIVRGISPDLSACASIALQREFRHTDNDSPMVVEALLLDLMSRHVDILRDRSVARPKWLSTLLDYLDDTFEQEWTLTNMAAEVGVHPVYLCRSFSEHFNCTLGEYIRKLRVLRGRQLLAIDDGTLAEIALQSGFADQSHFTRVFKKHFGLTPSDCRRRSLLRVRNDQKLLW